MERTVRPVVIVMTTAGERIRKEAHLVTINRGLLVSDVVLPGSENCSKSTMSLHTFCPFLYANM
jgi:hypothetical protein